MRGSSKRSSWRAEFLPFAIPLVTAGLLIAWYNYIRFDNPLEFGVRYSVGVMSLAHPAANTLALRLRGISAATQQLLHPKLERAIGVIYRPETERTSHYIYARLSEQFDAVIHFDHTRAVEPLERTAEWERGDLPVTYPVGV